ncbi:hypothetical protein QPK87_06735 [Kamptonema cortianum]|nr:hypothetical protein [Geitlerinema splendidum]MDK3156269.1 hypothetical protein [Kamptonema cortianum]
MPIEGSNPSRSAISILRYELQPTQSEQKTRDEIITRVLTYIKESRTILLPEFDPKLSRSSDEFAMVSVGIEPNPFGSIVGEYRYQFEGEEDLLHLMITKSDQSPLSAEEAQSVVSFLYPNVPTALMWFKPGTYSHHFYLGHDVLLEYL